MLDLGILVSGGGTNLQSILDAIAAGTLGARARVVISNKPSALALDRARAAGVATEVIGHKEFNSREDFDARLVERLRQHGCTVVVLAGFMRIVTPVLLDAFPDRVVNIHPSLLPAFPGVDAQEQAWRAGVRITGCTVHIVNRGVDTGPIIAQAAVPVIDGDTAESVRARILREEHRLLPTVLQWMSEGRVRLENGRVVVAGSGGEFAVASPQIAGAPA